MSQNNADLIRGAYDAFAVGDVPAVLAIMHPEIVWNEADHFPLADGNPYVGPDAVVQGVFTRLVEEWDGWVLNIDQILDAGDNVVATGRYSSTNKATGKALDCQFCHVWWVEDGKVTRFQQYADTYHARQVAGMD
jgi:ketosteroid isomerase-like protein